MKILISAVTLIILCACGIEEDNSRKEVDVPSKSNFCSCFENSDNAVFDEKMNDCLTDNIDQNSGFSFILQQIDSCEVFSQELERLKDDQLLKRAEDDVNSYVGSAEGSFEETFHEVNKLIIRENVDSLLILSEKLVELKPNSIEARFVKAYALERLAAYSKAKKEYEYLKKMTGRNDFDLSIKLVNRKI